jgi:endogenous inhibitor of DNA gyrase (YacG/DUF329 family)
MTEDKVSRLRPRTSCPICGKPSVNKVYPFCSNRCADIDLNRWLTGAYAIPASDDDDEVAGAADIDDAEI